MFISILRSPSFGSIRRSLQAAALAWVLSPVAAQAHAILLDSTPAEGAHESSGRVMFRLRFNSRIDAARSRVTLTAPDHLRSVLRFEPGPTPDLLQAAAELGPGAYQLRWQVLAVDGHITRGDVGFTLTPTAGTSDTGTPVMGAAAR